MQGRIRRDIAGRLTARVNPAGINRHHGAAGASGREIVIMKIGRAVI